MQDVGDENVAVITGTGLTITETLEERTHVPSVAVTLYVPAAASVVFGMVGF